MWNFFEGGGKYTGGPDIYIFFIVLVLQCYSSIMKTMFASVQVGRKDISTYKYKYSKGIYSYYFADTFWNK